ncbi:MAG: T9SS type A sorting domain-containing protein [Bacteroidetes bacterium]|nr:T9SS type A sorting domain-containing protein [Bacteroidota bacterium]
MIFILPLNVFSQGCWTQLADMPQSRYNLVSFEIADTGYVVTGQSAGGTFRNEFFKYDPNLNQWTQLTNFPGTARTGSVGFSIGSKGYVGTGRDNNGNTDQFWEYDPLLNSWTQKASFPPGNRESATGFSIGSKGYVGMGLNGTTKTDFYEYDPLTNMWTQKADFPVAIGRYAAVGFSIGSKGYVGTGYHSGFTRNNDFWEYDPATNSWLQLANVPGPARADAVGFSTLGVGYVGTGNQYMDFYSYDVSSNTWSQITDYGPGNREKATAFVVNDIAYVGSGYYLSIKSDWWKLDPASIVTNAPLIGCDSLLLDSMYYAADTSLITTVPGVTANGCDSIYIQPIIINNSTSIVLPPITECDSALIGGIYYNNDTTVIQNFSSVVTGCDSMVTVDLTINYADATVTTFLYTITANATGAVYQWLNCDSNYAVIPGETSQSFLVGSHGTFALAVTENNCTDTSSCINFTGIGIDEVLNSIRIAISPNPNTGNFFVSTGDEGQFKTIEILNFLGEVVAVEKTTGSITKFELNDQKGVFLVRCSGNGFTEIGRVVLL